MQPIIFIIIIIFKYKRDKRDTKDICVVIFRVQDTGGGSLSQPSHCSPGALSLHLINHKSIIRKKARFIPYSIT